MIKHTYVLAIDQSYTDTGITLMDEAENVVESISLKGKKNERKLEYREKLNALVMDYITPFFNAENEIFIVTERINTTMSYGNIKCIVALVASLKDTVESIYNLPVYSVNNKVWKKAITGTSKAVKNPYGIDERKFCMIKYCKEHGRLKMIAEEYHGKGTKGIVKIRDKAGTVKCYKLNDNIADSYGIALYAIRNLDKLEREDF